MKFIHSAMLALALGSAMTSCLSDGENTITGTDIYANGFNVITDRQTGDVSYAENPRYEINWKQDGSRETVALKFANLGIPEIPDYTYEFAEVGTGHSGYTYQVSISSATPTNMTSVQFSNIKVSYIRRVVRQSASSEQMVNRFVYAISYTVNNRYEVVVYPKTAYCFSKTTTLNLSDPSKVFTVDDYSTAPSYSLSFSTVSKKCSIKIDQAKFLEGMPALNMVFEDIPFTANANEISYSIDALTPKIGGDPYPGFPITNLRGTFRPMTATSLNFDCTPATVNNGQTTFRVSVALEEFPTQSPN